MYELEALKALGAFPIVQAAVAVMIILGGVYLIRRGERDRRENPNAIPQWLMIGPAHDAIGAIHDIAEQIRKQTDVLERIENHCRHTADNTQHVKTAMEMIRNESRLR